MMIGELIDLLAPHRGRGDRVVVIRPVKGKDWIEDDCVDYAIQSPIKNARYDPTRRMFEIEI